MAFKFNPTTGKLDLVDIYENAISITMAEYQTLISSSGLKPEQWYLITDFQNETIVPNSSNVITTGAVEQIYLRASSVNTFYPQGYSKTYPDEEITFKQNPANATANLQGNYDSGTATGDYLITVIDTDKIQFDYKVISENTTDFYLNYYNYSNDSYFEVVLGDKDTLFFWDEVNFIMTIPQVYDYDSNLIDSDFDVDNSYFEVSSTEIVHTFTKGMIVGRKNAINTVDVSADYRSQLCRRYKPDVPAWSAGTYAEGDEVSYGGLIWGALASTSSTPSGSAVNWVAIMADDYVLSANISVNGLVSFSIPINTADYQDLPILDTAQLDAIDYPINVNIKNLYQYDYVDVVISSLSGWRNATVVADKTTITGQVSDGKMTLTGSVLVGSTFSDIYLTNSLVRGALTTVTIANGSSLISAQQISSSDFGVITGVTYRVGASTMSAKTLSNMLYHSTATGIDYGTASSVRYSGTCTDNYWFSIYNCNFSNTVTGARHYGTTYYTNFLGQWIRNKSFGNMYGISNADRQTFGYTADNLFVANVALNYFSSGVNIINNKFLGGFSNNFTSANPANTASRIDSCTFNGTVSNLSGSGKFTLSRNVAGGEFGSIVFNNTTYQASILDTSFLLAFGTAGGGHTFNNTTEDFIIKYCSFGESYSMTFTRGSIEYSHFVGRTSGNTWGSTTTQIFNNTTVGNYFISNTINASVTRCNIPQYWSSRTITTAMTDLIILSDTENVGFGTDTPNANAIVDISSTTKAFMPPRMTTTQKNAITPTAGMVVYDSTTNKLCAYDGSAWQNCY